MFCIMPAQSRLNNNLTDNEEKNLESTKEHLLGDGSPQSGDLVTPEEHQQQQSADEEALTEPNEEERETWGKKIDFLLSVIGFAVDLANVWRFPYLCYKNGGGAFLVPYTIMLVFGGIPLFYMELALGQYHRKGAISSWGTVSPIFKGIGWAVVLIAFYTDFFYNVIISWALYYFFASFTSKLPWTRCGPWATDSCFDGHITREERYPMCTYKERQSSCSMYHHYRNVSNMCADANTTSQHVFNITGGNCTTNSFEFPTITNKSLTISLEPTMLSFFNSTVDPLYNATVGTLKLHNESMEVFCSWKPNSTSAAAEYFERGVLGLHQAPDINNIGGIRWQNTLCLLAIYLICYFSLWKGISTSGKVVWFTALFPYAVLFILLIRGVTLPGASTGILEYVTPKFDRILKASVWVDAATQVFFSLGPGFGVLLAYASYNKFHNNVYRDAIMTSLINCGTSFLAGFVIFSILGYMSQSTCTDFYDVAQEGPGLVFEVYPEAIATLPGSTVWSLIFFLMLLTLGLDSSFGGSEAIITGITDEFPALKKKREYFVAVLFAIYFLIGLASCTYGGFYVVHLFETFAAGYSILFAVLIETVVISWVYGVFRFSSDIKAMIGFSPGLFWVSCWSIIAPVFIGTIMIYGISQYEPLKHQNQDYPHWAIALGWMMAVSSMACIPIYAILQIIKHKGDWKSLFNGWWSMPGGCFDPVKEEYMRPACTRRNNDKFDTTQENGRIHTPPGLIHPNTEAHELEKL